MEKMNQFEDLKKAFARFKKLAGSPSYAACFGKTFLDQKSSEYKTADKVAQLLIEHGFGVIHGAYSGVMEASSRGADKAIAADKKKNHYWNIGVPMRIFDKELKRSSRVNLPSAKDISDRKRALIDFCDVCIVLPSGGFGTLLESLEIFHMNQLAEKFGGKIRPLIFLKGNWKKIFDDLYRDLDMTKQKGGQSFAYFPKTIGQLEKIIIRLKAKGL